MHASDIGHNHKNMQHLSRALAIDCTLLSDWILSSLIFAEVHVVSGHGGKSRIAPPIPAGLLDSLPVEAVEPATAKASTDVYLHVSDAQCCLCLVVQLYCPLQH